MKAKPRPEAGQWWRFEREEARVVQIYPGGGGGMGIAEFSGGNIPPTHVCIMLHFNAWVPLAGPSTPSLPPPCTCRQLEGGVLLSDGCALHDAAYAGAAAATASNVDPRALREAR